MRFPRVRRVGRFVASLLLLSGASCETDVGLARDPVVCPLSVVPLAGEPRIDGALEEGLRLHPFEPKDWSGPEPLPEGFAVAYALAHRPDGLYVFVRVEGTGVHPAPETSHPYCGDAVEIFVDSDGVYDEPGRYDAAGSMQFVIGIPETTSSSPRTRLYRQTVTVRDADSLDRFAFRTEQGFAVEVFLRAHDLDLDEWNLAPGRTIGFNLAIGLGRTLDGSETDGCAGRLGQFFLAVDQANVDCPYPYCSTASFCPVAIR